MTIRRAVLIVAAVLILLPALAVGVFLLTFNPNAYAPAIIAAVQKSTGRELVLGSPITIALSLTPTIEADNVSLANPPGFPDRNFATLQKIDAQIALLPLLSHIVDIRRLVLSNPVVTLETDAGGGADWDFSSPRQPARPGQPAAAPDGATPYKITLEAVELQNGQIVVKNAAGAQTGALAIASLTGAAPSAAAPLNIQAQAAYNGAPFTLSGQLGPVERFFGIGSRPWPVDLTLAANGATATINGTIANPREAAGYDLALTAAIPALESFQPWAGTAVALPPIHGLTAAAHLRDQNAAMPAVSGLFIRAAASDLSGFRPGLTLSHLDIEMPSLNQKVSVDIAGTLNNQPLALTGSIGAVAALLNPAWLPAALGQANPQAASPSYPVNLTAQAGAASIALTGGVATPGSYAGVALGLTANIPDLAALAPLTGQALPGWKNIALQATVTDPGGLGLAKSVGLDGLTLTMDNAALGGDASLYFGAQPRLELALKAQTINLDALLAALPATAATPSPAPLTAAPTEQTSDFTQSTVQLPVKLLQTASADLQLAADTLVFNKAAYTALQTHAVLAGGVLTINPLTAILPGGGVDATATIDATKTPPAETVSIHAPALALGPFLKAIDLPDDAEGTLQATLNANGAGATPRDMFAGINGQLGLASVNGVIDGTVLDALFGAVLRTIGLPESVIGAQGPVAMRCFALRMDAANGVGTIRALTLDSSRLMLQGGGTVSFGDDLLDVIIRPQLRVAGADLGVPVQIGGTFTNPTTGIAPMSALQQAAKSALGLPVTIVQKAAGANGLLGQVVGDLGLGDVVGGGPAPDVCPAALTLARLGQPGPAPAAPSTPQSGATPAKPPSGPQNLLNGLFGK